MNSNLKNKFCGNILKKYIEGILELFETTHTHTYAGEVDKIWNENLIQTAIFYKTFRPINN